MDRNSVCWYDETQPPQNMLFAARHRPAKNHQNSTTGDTKPWTKIITRRFLYWPAELGYKFMSAQRGDFGPPVHIYGEGSARWTPWECEDQEQIRVRSVYIIYDYLPYIPDVCPRRRLPLHCAVDKVFCSPELVRILVEAYPEGAAEEDDTGRSPLACALRWEHSNTILMIMLRHNRYERRRLYLVVRYGVILGRFIYCVEYAAKKFGGRKRSLSVSYAPSESHRAPVQGRRSFDGAKGRTQSEDTAYCNLP